MVSMKVEFSCGLAWIVASLRMPKDAVEREPQGRIKHKARASTTSASCVL